MGLRIAIYGISSAIGAEIGSQCDADPKVEAIVGIDAVPPRLVPEKCHYLPLGPDVDLSAAFSEHRVNVAMYLSPFPCGRTPVEPAGELLEVFLAACASVACPRIIVVSGYHVYETKNSGDRPLREGATLGAAPSVREADLTPDMRRERTVARFARENPTANVALARLANVIGPRTHGVGARLLEQKKLVALQGVDPYLQFLHTEDAGLALFRLMKSIYGGVFNVAPDDAMSLIDLGRSLRRPVTRVSPGWARTVTGPGRFLGLDRLVGIDKELIPLLSNRVNLGNRKLTRDLGYRFKYASDGAVADHVQPHR